MSATSSRLIRSLIPRSASRSFSRIVSGVAARSTAHSSRLNSRYRLVSTTPTLRTGPGLFEPTPYSDAIDALARKTLGAWYTPSHLVDHVLDEVLEPALAARTSADG